MTSAEDGDLAGDLSEIQRKDEFIYADEPIVSNTLNGWSSSTDEKKDIHEFAVISNRVGGSHGTYVLLLLNWRSIMLKSQRRIGI